MQCSSKGTTAPTRTSSLDNRLQNWTSPTMLLCFPCRRCVPQAATWQEPPALPSLVAGPPGAASAASLPAPEACEQPPPAPTPGLFIDLL